MGTLHRRRRGLDLGRVSLPNPRTRFRSLRESVGHRSPTFGREVGGPEEGNLLGT